jgi:hypothetical protein
MAGYTLKANLEKLISSAELAKYSDSDDTVTARFINVASSMMWSRLVGRQDYLNDADMNPSDYDTSTNPYPLLGYMCDMLTIDLMRWRKGGAFAGDGHFVLQWCEDCRMNRADIATE